MDSEGTPLCWNDAYIEPEIDQRISLLFPTAPLFAIAAILLAATLKMAKAWENFVILRAGKLQSVKGPGLFLILQIVDSVTAIIDARIQTAGYYPDADLDGR